jgi:tetratricopeptide (TPR) repeat protein
VVAVLLAAGYCGCHRKSTKGAGADNTSAPTVGESEAERTRREAQALVDKGRELYKDDHDEEAAAAFKQAVQIDPEFAEAHFRLGMAYGSLEQKPDAEESYKKAIELYKTVVQSDSKNADAFFNMGEAYSFLHLDEEAARYFKQAIHLRADDEEAYYELGETETRLARYTEASASFQKALDIDPDDYRVTDALENAREGAKRIQEGKKHAVDMLKKQQGDANKNANSGAPSTTKPTPKKPGFGV